MTPRAGIPASRIAWIVDRIDYDIASFRYRCLIPAYELTGRGIESIIATVENLRAVDADVFIFVKVFGKKHLEFARVLCDAKRPFVLDICDNIFFSDYAPKRNIGDQNNFAKMAAQASRVVVTGPALAEIARPHLPEGNKPVIIPDASFTLFDHLRIFEWFDSMRFVHRWNKKRFLCSSDAVHLSEDSMRKWAIRSISSLSSPQKAIAAAKRLILSYRLGRPRPEAKRRRRRKLIWFGKHGTTYGKVGMQSLMPIIPHLIQINKLVPIELVIISNSRRKYRELFGNLPFPTRYRRWSHEVVFDELMMSDAFLMPNETDGFSACKSANRALMSLAMGVPVITTPLESMKLLGQAVVIDDWEGGLRNYLLDENSKVQSLEIAADIIARFFAPQVIGQQWEEVLSCVGKSRALEEACN